MKTSYFKRLLPLFTATLLGASVAMAQDAPPPPAPGGGNDREAFRQRMNERLKSALKVSDDEWSIIQPLLEKVQQKQRQVMSSRTAGMFGGERRANRPQDANNNGNNNPNATNPNANRPRPERPSVAEIEALKTTVENESSSSDEIKAKLEAVRALRKKAEAELEASSEELRKVLTLRQEAVLVMMGIL